MDGAFFHAAVIDVLEEEGVEYAIKVPFWRWLGLKECIARRRKWERVDETVESFCQWLWVPAWSRVMRAVVYRKRVRHRTSREVGTDLDSRTACQFLKRISRIGVWMAGQLAPATVVLRSP